MWTAGKISQVYYSSKIFVGMKSHNCANMFAVSSEKMHVWING